MHSNIRRFDRTEVTTNKRKHPLTTYSGVPYLEQGFNAIIINMEIRLLMLEGKIDTAQLSKQLAKFQCSPRSETSS